MFKDSSNSCSPGLQREMLRHCITKYKNHNHGFIQMMIEDRDCKVYLYLCQALKKDSVRICATSKRRWVGGKTTLSSSLKNLPYA